jgi:signal transduction histidine kinase
VAFSTATLLAIGLVALLAIVGITYFLAERSRSTFEELLVARDTRAAAVELRNALITAESSQRGFMVSGNEVYLAPYSTAKGLALQNLDNVASLLADDPASAVISRLREIVNEKIAEMDRTISLKRERGEDDVMAIFQSNRGKALMDEANIFFNGLILTADDRLTQGVSENRSNFASLRWLTIIGGLAIVAVVGFAVASVLRYTRELSSAHAELSVLNADLESRVTDRTAQLQKANDEIQRFAYIVTHDLRAPLVNIMGFTSELEASVNSLKSVVDNVGDQDSKIPATLLNEARRAVAEDLPEAIGFIRSSTRKMDSLINAILKLSREGRRSLRPESINVRDIIESTVSTLQHQVQESGGEISFDLSVAPIRSDRVILEQVFGNVLDNAIKYQSPSRRLKVTVQGRKVADDRIEVAISDNGRGIAEHDQERIFELFRRAGAQDQAGEGIGLAHVRAMLRRLGGDISVASVLDHGTTFKIVLPINSPGEAHA